MEFLVVVIGVVLIFEGLPWFLSPTAVRRMLRQLGTVDDRSLRGLGFTLMMIGLLLVYLAKG